MSLLSKELARQVWDEATGFGTPGATTTFHSIFNKNDPTTRPMALGFLKRIKLVKYMQGPNGSYLTRGVNFTHASANPMREARVRKGTDQFLALCVESSKDQENWPGDYESVCEARSMIDGSFCLYPGFIWVLSKSGKFKALVEEWRREEQTELAAYPPAPPPLPVQGPVAPPPAIEPNGDGGNPADWSDDEDENASPAPAPAPAPVTAPTAALDDDDEPEPSVQAPPPKRQKTAAKKRCPDPNASTDTEHWPVGCMGRLVMRDFVSGKNNAKDIVFGPTNAYVLNVRGDYQIVVKRRREGRSGASGATDAYVYLSGDTKRASGVSQLRSVPEIARHFNQHTQFNAIPSY